MCYNLNIITTWIIYGNVKSVKKYAASNSARKIAKIKNSMKDKFMLLERNK
jgi:hypothetical protein